jgi:hypothetical protein
MSLPRFEHKYRITERTAFAVRDYISSYLEPDRHIVDARKNCYPVNNVYLDSDDLKTYWTAINEEKDRYKLRIRTYGESPDLPVFCEVKRRVHGETIKSRGAVHRSAVDSLLAGDMPSAEDMAVDGVADLRAAMMFVDLVRRIDAKPKARVSYSREAWVSPDSELIRLTMDREVKVAPTTTPDLSWDNSIAPTYPFGDNVVLEIKISGNAPFWFMDLEQAAGLRRGSAAKYCDGVLTRGEQEFSANYSAPCDLEALTNIENRRRKLELIATEFAGGQNVDQKKIA